MRQYRAAMSAPMIMNDLDENSCASIRATLKSFLKEEEERNISMIHCKAHKLLNRPMPLHEIRGGAEKYQKSIFALESVTEFLLGMRIARSLRRAVSDLASRMLEAGDISQAGGPGGYTNGCQRTRRNAVQICRWIDSQRLAHSAGSTSNDRHACRRIECLCIKKPSSCPETG